MKGMWFSNQKSIDKSSFVKVGFLFKKAVDEECSFICLESRNTF